MWGSWEDMWLHFAYKQTGTNKPDGEPGAAAIVFLCDRYFYFRQREHNTHPKKKKIENKKRYRCQVKFDLISKMLFQNKTWNRPTYKMDDEFDDFQDLEIKEFTIPMNALMQGKR